MDQAIEKEIFTRLDKLPSEKQQQVLNFIRAITTLTGVAGGTLLRFAGTIEPDDLQLIAQAIEEGCERVNADEW